MTSPVSMPAGHAIVATDLDAYENATAAWPTWSPTLTNITNVNGTVVAKYRQVGKTVDYRFKFSLGSSSAIGTSPKFTLPATPNSDYVDASGSCFPIGQAFLVHAGVATRIGLSVVLTGSTATIFSNNFATGEASTGITAAAPWTWATGDMLHVWGTYETN